MKQSMLWLWLPLAACSVCQGDLIVNGGFDETDGKRTKAWNEVAPQYVYRDGAGRSGTRALCFENYNPKFYTFPGQKLKLEPGKAYDFEVWVKTENLKGDEQGASICVEWSDAKGKWIGGSYAEAVSGTRDWTCIKSCTTRIPTNAASMVIHPYVRKGMVGKAWFDDVAIKERIPKPVEGVYTTIYRNRANTGKVTFKAALNLQPNAADKYRITFYWKDAQGKECSQTVKALDARNAEITLDVANLQAGAQQVIVSAFDERVAKEIGREKTIFTKAPPQRTGTWFDEAGRTIVNGKPFFPLGMYWSSIDPAKLEVYAKSSFNCLMPYGSPSEVKLMDLCQEKGIKVIYSVKDIYCGTRWAPSGIKTEADEVAFIKGRVAKFKNHPALLAWYLNDELPVSMLSRLTARRDLMEELDPNHPGWVVLYQWTQIRDYLSTFDVIGTDPYPIPSSPASMATKWTRATKEGTMGGKPLWQVPQAFNWGSYKKDEVEKAKCRPPTQDELRSMSWQCIANGANGLIMYSFYDLYRAGKEWTFESRWADCCSVAEQVSNQFDVLLADPADVVTQVKASSDLVSTRAWQKGDTKYLLVVNPETTALPVVVTLKTKATEIKSRFGNVPKVDGKQLSFDLPALGQTLISYR